MRTLRLAVAALALTALAPSAGASAQGARPPTILRPPDARELPREALGAQLFAANCARCHGIDGRGVPRARTRGSGEPELGPPLRGVGALSADFYLRTGYMPISDPYEQPRRKRVGFDEREIEALVGHVESLGGGPPVPDPRPERGDLAEGRELFAERCAGCHHILARGGIVTGARAPALTEATPTQVAQAIRIGPYAMPRFSRGDIDDAQLDSLVRYVERAKRPHDPGGWAIGNVGSVVEGAVTWIVVGALLAIALLVGRRRRA